MSNHLGPRTLPSGRVIPLIQTGVPDRPWEVEAAGALFVIVRQKRGDSSQKQYFKADRLEPLLFEREDAEALASMMNSALRRATPRGRGRDRDREPD